MTPFADDCRDVGDNGTRAHQLAGLMAIVAKLGDEECAVLQLVAERLLTGQGRYGRFAVATDPRNWHAESLDEIADALVYAACGLMRGAGR